MKTIRTDVAIVGAGGAGLRSAIEIAEKYPKLKTALIAKVLPMRSHTCAAEGGAAGVIRDDDNIEYHFNDTVSGADWLADQDVVDYFVNNATKELIQMEHWGCPWSRKPDGNVNVRRFGGMKIERTWFAADKTGFHMLHTLFQTSIKHLGSITRFDEFFCFDLIVVDGVCQGVLAIEISTGEIYAFIAKAVILATGGAGRIYPHNTNGGIVTGDGMAMAYRNGVALRDMEFVQYHPTGLAGTGILMTEGCRGEGGLLTNKDGYRYLQDYGLGPVTDEPKNKYMELGPRDRLSQAFWQEEQKGRVIQTPKGTVVNLDLRHLGEKYLLERLPFICELSKAYAGVNPVNEPIPVRPVVHYTMGGIQTDINTATSIKGLFAIGECASVGLHGANRLGSNSLTELLVFGKVAGENAAEMALSGKNSDEKELLNSTQKSIDKVLAIIGRDGNEKSVDIKEEMYRVMEGGVGIYRKNDTMQEAVDTIAKLKELCKKVKVSDNSKVYNTEWLYMIELEYLLDVAESMAHSAINRKESRGSHQRIDGFEERDDSQFLKHTLSFYNPEGAPKIEYSEVVITKSQPAKRLYGEEGEQQDKNKQPSN